MMIELVLVYCMAKICVEESTRQVFRSETACLVGSQMAAAEWLRQHPGIFVVGIKCRPLSKTA
jgi:hypothetical protein